MREGERCNERRREIGLQREKERDRVTEGER